MPKKERLLTDQDLKPITDHFELEEHSRDKKLFLTSALFPGEDADTSCLA